MLQAAQQGHSQIVNLLLEANASPNTTSNVSRIPSFVIFINLINMLPLSVTLCIAHDLSHNELVQTGQTALSIAQKLGYISVVETLKVRQPLTLEYDHD